MEQGETWTDDFGNIWLATPTGIVSYAHVSWMTDAERRARIKYLMDSFAPGQFRLDPKTGKLVPTLAPGGITAPSGEPTPAAPPVEEKKSKPIHEMTFADYQKGVDAWWPNRRRD